ncbi:MAG: sulfite exporter TauE/SafE family protein [Burkholderiaceae bacterium]|nr:sulfite exporter TauE/SafE family protein [Burkholderiaceae bacterium]
MSLSILLGAVVGLIMGMTGAGGGILAVPLLVFGLHLTVAGAAPIGLLAVGIAAAMGAVVGLRAGVVRYRAALLIALVGVVCNPLGLWLALRMPVRYLTLLFAAVLIGVAVKGVRDVRRAGRQAGPGSACPCHLNTASGRLDWNVRCATRLSAMGAAAGMLSGLLGVGGGFVIVPALQHFSDLAMRSIVATSLAVIALISLVSVAGAIHSGHFDVALGVPFAAGATAGMLLGGRFAAQWKPEYLKLAFSLICLAVACGLIAKTFL